MNRGNGWELVQLQQVRDGWAWASYRYQEDCPSFQVIATAQKEAKAARRGIWAGNPEPPWVFRQRNR